MKRRRGFILAYATVVMAFVMILITGMITLVNSSALIGIRAGVELDERMKLDQIGEYFAAGREDLASARAEEWGYAISYSDLPTSAASDSSGNSPVNVPAGVRSASVSKEGKTVLYIERKPSESGVGYTVICWIYGEKGENDAV